MDRFDQLRPTSNFSKAHKDMVRLSTLSVLNNPSEETFAIAIKNLDGAIPIDAEILMALFRLAKNENMHPFIREQCRYWISYAAYSTWPAARDTVRRPKNIDLRFSYSPSTRHDDLPLKPSIPEPIGAFSRHLDHLARTPGQYPVANAHAAISLFMQWNVQYGWASGSWTVQYPQTHVQEASISYAEDSHVIIKHDFDALKIETTHGKYMSVPPPHITAFLEHWSQQKYLTFLDTPPRLLSIKSGEKQEPLIQYLQELREVLRADRHRYEIKDWRASTYKSLLHHNQRFSTFLSFDRNLFISYAILAKDKQYRSSDLGLYDALLEDRNILIEHLRQRRSGPNIGYFAMIDWSPALGFHLHLILIRKKFGGSAMLAQEWKTLCGGFHVESISALSSTDAYQNMDTLIGYRNEIEIKQNLLNPLICASRAYRVFRPNSKQQNLTSGTLERKKPSNDAPSSRLRFGRAAKLRMEIERERVIIDHGYLRIGYTAGNESEQHAKRLAEIYTWVHRLIGLTAKGVDITPVDFKYANSFAGQFLQLSQYVVERGVSLEEAKLVTLHPAVRIFHQVVIERRANRAYSAEEQAPLHLHVMRTIRIRARSAIRSHDVKRRLDYQQALAELTQGPRRPRFVMSFEVSNTYTVLPLPLSADKPFQFLFRSIRRMIARLQKSMNPIVALWTPSNVTYQSGNSSLRCSAHLVFGFNTSERIDKSTYPEFVSRLITEWRSACQGADAANLSGCDHPPQAYEFCGRPLDHQDPPMRRARCAAAYLAWSDSFWSVRRPEKAPHLSVWRAPDTSAQ